MIMGYKVTDTQKHKASATNTTTNKGNSSNMSKLSIDKKSTQLDLDKEAKNKVNREQPPNHTASYDNKQTIQSSKDKSASGKQINNEERI